MQFDFNDKVILITGVSSGLGQSLANYLLACGARVAGTFRNAQQADAFTAAHHGKALGVVMDITQPDHIRGGVAQVVDTFGRIDVLANNVGAGLVGAVEESNDQEIRDVFEVNFFGGLNVIRAVLPQMRAQKSGHILQFSAIGGFQGVSGLGVYAAAKGATDILGEGLASELKPLGINVTVLTIGVFETEFASQKLRFTENTIEDYMATPAGPFRQFIGNLQGKQPNDASKVGPAIAAILASDNPPVFAPLGGDAVAVMRGKLARIEADVAAWEDNATSTAKA